MAHTTLTDVSGIDAAAGSALADMGIHTPTDLVLAPRETIRAGLKAAGIKPLPSMERIAGWQDRARELRLDPPEARSDWEREATYVMSLERRDGANGEERQTVVERAESDAPAQHVEPGWRPEAAGAWITGQLPAGRARPFTGPPGRPQHPAPDAPEPEHPARRASAAPGAEQDNGNAIRYWNAVALEANRIAHTTGADRTAQGPTASARALAIVHLAMHDAYASMTGEFDTWLTQPPVPDAKAKGDAAVVAAIQAAAQTTLRAIYQSRIADFDRAEVTGPGSAEGRQHGERIAQAILLARSQDPDPGGRDFAPHPGRGRHRVDPANPGQGHYGPLAGTASMFAVARNAHAREIPRWIDHPSYPQALREVRGKGIAPELQGTLPPGTATRTPDETLTGLFWAYDGARGIGTPPRLYNQIVREVSARRGNSIGADARLFALVNVAMADAGTLAWAEKYHPEAQLWRPVLGIRENDPAMGPEGQTTAGAPVGDDCDSMWLPLGAPRTNPPPGEPRRAWGFSPPFPAYPSGHATFGAAALQAVRLFYGLPETGPDDLLTRLVSDELDGVAVDERGGIRPRHERAFPGGLWQMIEENARSRVYLGVHWIFDAFGVDANGEMDLSQNVGGVPLGLGVALDLHTNGLHEANGSA